MLYKHRESPVAKAMLQGLGVMIAINVVNSFMPGIALEAHFGGLVAGAAVEAIILAIGSKNPELKAFANR